MTHARCPPPHGAHLRAAGHARQVWDAIATANGISAWFLRTDLEEREGGAICTSTWARTDHRPAPSPAWDPPRDENQDASPTPSPTGRD